MDVLEQHGVKVVHHFSEREYAKETHIPAGIELTQHRHKFSHLSVLASGRAIVEMNGLANEHEGPACLTIGAGAAHKVTAITDVVWYCIHSTQGETSVEAIESEVIA